MGFRVGDTEITLSLVDEQFKKQTASVRTSLKATADSMRQVSAVARNMLLIEVAAVAGVVKLASDAEEIQSKFEAVFKDETRAAETWAKTFGGAVGRSSTTLKAMMATLQDTFVPLGFMRKEARLLSQTLTKLSVDVASFQNTSDADTLRDFQSALVGNHETVRKYGIIITEARLSMELLNMGIEGGNKKATAQQKVMARLNLILAGTSDAQGDALRTAGSFANQVKALTANLQDAGEELGAAFIPMLSETISEFREGTKGVRDFISTDRELIVSLTKTSAALLAIIFLGPKFLAFLAAVAAHPAIFAVGALAAGVVALQGAMKDLARNKKELADITGTLAKDTKALIAENHGLVNEYIALAKIQDRTIEQQTRLDELGGKLAERGLDMASVFRDAANAIEGTADAMQLIAELSKKQLIKALEQDVLALASKVRAAQAEIENFAYTGGESFLSRWMGKSDEWLEMERNVAKLQKRLWDARLDAEKVRQGGAVEGPEALVDPDKKMPMATAKVKTAWQKIEQALTDSTKSELDKRLAAVRRQAEKWKKVAKDRFADEAKHQKELTRITEWRTREEIDLHMDAADKLSTAKDKEVDAETRKVTREFDAIIKEEERKNQTLKNLKLELLGFEEGQQAVELAKHKEWLAEKLKLYEDNEKAKELIRKLGVEREKEIRERFEDKDALFRDGGAAKEIQRVSFTGVSDMWRQMQSGLTTKDAPQVEAAKDQKDAAKDQKVAAVKLSDAALKLRDFAEQAPDIIQKLASLGALR